METQLNAYILSNGSLSLEYGNAEDKTANQQKSLEKKICSFFHEDHISSLFYLGTCDRDIHLSPSLQFWRKFSHEYVEKIRLNPDVEFLRSKVSTPVDQSFLKEMMGQIPFVQGAEYITSCLLEEYWHRLNSFFQTGIKSFKGSVEDFFHQYAPDVHLIGKIYFHLVENKDDEEYPFAFLATYAHGISSKGKSQHKPLKYALTEYENDQKKMLELLSTVNNASRQSSFISKLLDTGDIFHPLSWSANDAFKFLKEIEIYEDAGILCRIPNWWKKKTNHIRLNITVGDKKPSLLGLDSLVDFNAGLVLEDISLSLKEAEELLAQTEGLAYIKGKWVAIDKDSLKETLSSLEKAKKLMKEHNFSLSEALRLLISPQSYGGLGDSIEENIEVNCGEWLESVLEKMRNPDLIRSVSPVKDFKAVLRPYQQTGLNWLFLMHSLGFGACLADDMGLGKTIQVLAFFQTLQKKNGNMPTNLLILPASLLANWASEIKRFSPSLKFTLAHPSADDTNFLKDANKEKIDRYDLIITTYGLAKRYDWIKSYNWNYIVLDEAQAIKNPATAQTRAVKKLKSLNRIILTGTPIENRLSDLWSLFDFINPGLLGSSREFSDLNKKFNENAGDYSSLRRTIGPYILRRLKTDKSIISDLPDKIEVNSYASLSKKQAVLYKQLVEKLKDSLEIMDGIQRRGIILASLMKFKQICNHPDQYLGLSSYAESESGKFLRLREIFETIFEKREKALIFTQFKEMTEPIDRFLSALFGKSGLVLHGGTPVKKRKKLVDSFQSDEYIPYFVLSVKAGGTGLNLTAANHVIHFDRWWNPAVENQATDRAFRIGQKRSVMVHKFITQGTIEEKIDKMIEGKKQLAEDVIADTGEKWITEMNNEELIDMFKMK